jgi:hydrogenase 3 maturation protease
MDIDREFLGQLEALRGSKTLILGIGNVLKGDDGAGPAVCEKLKSAKICAEVIDAGTVPENYIGPIIKRSPENLLIVDAIDFGATTGSTRMFKAGQLSSYAFSTHTLSPHLFVEMIRKDIDVEVYLVGIQPEHVELGQPLSEGVKGAVESLCRSLEKVFAA